MTDPRISTLRFVGIVLLPLALLAGCKQPAAEPVTHAEPPATISGASITSEEIAKALGMHRVRIALPGGSGHGEYGLTFRHQDGYLPAGFSTFADGTLITLIYWSEGQHLKYSLQSATSGSSGEIDVTNAANFRIRSVPDQTKIYGPGDVFEKWSVNHNMTSLGGNEHLEPGEVGLCLVNRLDARAFKPFAVTPAPHDQDGSKPAAGDADEKKVDPKF